MNHDQRLYQPTENDQPFPTSVESETNLFRTSRYPSTMTIGIILCLSSSICTVLNVIPAIFI